ncbi:MAG: class II fructose-bisphosphatase [Chlamydiae bacterium]|nr:class II fructose-bisphosphatase [Chlamydiota bacterium]MBI3277830.1 class II fructose-bisphosphatase [Chlamydiota bacterium]
MREINLDIVRVTEAAARAAATWIGSGDKESADKAATDAMRSRLNGMDFRGRIVIGEGIKDKSPGLFAGEMLGKLEGSQNYEVYDIAVDPIEGTRPVANSGPEAMSVMAVAGENSLFSTPEFYMNKLAYGPEIAKKIHLDITDPLDKTLKVVSAVTGKILGKIVVCVLDRPRHEKVIKELRGIGVRIKLIQDCDVSGAIATCLPDSGIDLLYGMGGSPEGVIAACGIKCLRGGFQAQVVKKDFSLADSKVYSIEDLVKGPCTFAATGITNGSLLKGVRYTSLGAVTHSVFMRYESGTVRWVTAYHGN